MNPCCDGTDSGYHLHLRRKTQPCDASRKAHNEANAAWRAANRDYVNATRRFRRGMGWQSQR